MNQPATLPAKYSIVTRAFHWIGALLIVIAVILINMGNQYIALHKAVGVSFLIWTVLRIINRFISKAPPALPAPKWQIAIAHLTHLGLYIAMLAMPTSGLLMSMYGGRATSVFGLFEIAPMVSPNRQLAGIFNELHTDFWFVFLVCLVIAHVGAALYHQFILKDNIIARMK